MVRIWPNNMKSILDVDLRFCSEPEDFGIEFCLRDSKVASAAFESAG